MTLAEKVLKGLECCDDTSRATLRCEECPYNDGKRTCSSIERLHVDALELLKAYRDIVNGKEKHHETD